MKDSKRLAVLLRRATIFCQSDFRFALKNCERSAQFVRGISDEPALAFKGRVETIEKPVEGCGEAAKLILRILNGKAVVDCELADVVRLRRHVRDGSKAFAREEIASHRGEHDGEGNQPAKRGANMSEQSTFRMKGRENDQAVGISCGRKSACIAPGAAMFTRKSVKWLCRRCEWRDTGFENRGRNLWIQISSRLGSGAGQ